MTGEGRFIDSLGDGIKTVLPGGADVEGALKVDQSDFIQCNFDSTPLSCAKVGAGAATGTTGNENLCNCGGVVWEYHILGTQTIIAPSLGTGGLEIGLDQTANDGAEFCLGISSQNKGVFTVGTSDAFYAKMKFSQSDVSGQDECCFGFRKVEAYQATLDGLDAMAVLNNISGNINIETITDGGTNVTTDTTLNFADAATHTFEVYVSAAGVVTYKVDGATPTTVAAFTFTDAEVVVPFFYYLHDATSPGSIILKSFECGLQ